MADSFQEDISGIGAVLFVRSRRARHVSVTVKSARTVRVAVPLRGSIKEAREFVHLKRPWILKHLARFRQAEKRRGEPGQAGRVIDRTAAAARLTRRLEELAAAHGFKYHRVYIRNQRTRWGSCSSLGNISLNIKLVLLPDRLVDYVLLHELVHTEIHNHSRRFWTKLDSYVGDAKALTRQLREAGLALL